MTAAAIIKDIQQKKFAPVYVLQGEEPYYIDLITEALLDNVLNEAEREFNQSILYGKDINERELLPIVKRFPMGSERQLIIVKEAQNLRKLELLEPLLKNPVPSSIFVLNLKGKKLDKRKAYAKSMDKSVVVYNSEKIRDYNLQSWIKSYAHERNFRLDEQSIFLLSEYLGNDLGKISNELEKLKILLKEGEEISPGFIEKHIGISKEYNIWELQDAIGKRDHMKAQKMVHYFGKNEKAMPFELFIGSMFSYFTKLMKVKLISSQSELNRSVPGGPFAVKKAQEGARNFSIEKLEDNISILHQYDLRKKGVKNGSADYPALLQELVYKFIR
ncbi:MAG: DNA polymerase III subunit delta [Bacteroidota bacterium]